MKKKILIVLLSAVMAIVMMPTAAFAGTTAAAKIGETEYTNLNDALAEAQEGETVEIIKAGTYTALLAGLSGFTIQGDVEGVILDGSTSPSQWSNMTVKNVTVAFGQDNYRGFQHNNNLRFEECTFTGLHFSYGNETYYKCTFNQTQGEYNMWMYGTTVTYDECTFNCQGKCINVYNEGNVNTLKAIFKKCHFNSTVKNKSAVNVKETCGSTILKCDVSFDDCVVDTPDFFPTDKNGGSMLWMVDDLAPEKKGETVVTVNGVKVWEKGAKVKAPSVAIGDTKYKTLADAIEAVKDNETITLLEDSNVVTDYAKVYGGSGYSESAGANRLIIGADEAKNFTLDLNGKTLTGRINFLHGNLKIKNGKIRSSSQAINIYGSKNYADRNTNYTVVTVASDVEITSDIYGVCVFGGNPNNTYWPVGFGEAVNFYGKVTAPVGIGNTGNIGMDTYEDNLGKVTEIEELVESSDCNSCSELMTKYGPALNFYEGAVVNASEQAVYWPGLGRINVMGGSITGREAIGVKGGIVNISGGTLIANGPKCDPVEAVNSGEEASGAAISISTYYNANYPITVNISGGTFKSTNNVALLVAHSVKDKIATPVTKGINLTVSDGIFSGGSELGGVYVEEALEGEVGKYPAKFITGGLFDNDVNGYVAEGCKAAEIDGDDYHYIVGLGAESTDMKLTAGKFSINPIAYVASNYTVVPSGNKYYPYEVKTDGGIAEQDAIVIEKPTETTVSEQITNPEEVQAAKDAAMKADISGVANALTEEGQENIINKAITDDSLVTKDVIEAAKQIDISITVKAEVTASKTIETTSATEKILAFELKPYAVVTATDSEGNRVQSDEIKVDNEYLEKQGTESIAVRLGAAFKPMQVVHIKDDQTVEMFKEADVASYEDRTFTYDGTEHVVILNIKEFSEVQLLATENYVNAIFDANGGSGSMDTVSVGKGEQYTLPKCTFTAPEGKEFSGWKIGDTTYKVGDVVTLGSDTTITAQWTKVAKPLTQTLLVKGATSGKKAVKLSWNAVPGATKYVVYGQNCGKKYKMLKTTTKTSYTVKKIKGKKLKAHKYYKFYVVAQTPNGNVQSKSIHFITGKTKGKYANAKSVSATATLALDLGKTANVNAKYKMPKGKKHIKKTHGAAIRYISDCQEVATVDANGNVRALAAGTAKIYSQDVGGKYAVTTVTVKIGE